MPIEPAAFRYDLRKSNALQNGIENTKVGIQNKVPDDRNDNGGKHIGEVKQESVNIRFKFPETQSCQGNGKQHRKAADHHFLHQNNDKVIFDGRQEFRIA